MRNGSLRQLGAQYLRFSVVGVSNALVDLGALNLLLVLAPTRYPALLVLYNLAAVALANANSYLLNSRWTFQTKSPRPRQV